MDVGVPDASALAAIAFGEPAADSVAGLLHGKELYAPSILPWELANVAWKKSRRATGLAKRIAEHLDLALRLDVTTVEVDLRAALKLALGTDVTVYDAGYLWVARQVGGPLVTFDARLRAAARSARIPVLPR